MPMDVYAALGALVRAEATRVRDPKTDASASSDAAHATRDSRAAAHTRESSALASAHRPYFLALRRLAAIFH